MSLRSTSPRCSTALSLPALLVLLAFAPTSGRAGSCGLLMEREAVSPGGLVTARLFLEGEWPEVELLRSGRRFGTFQLGKSRFGLGAFFVFDDGSLITTGQYCWSDADSHALVAYRPSGEVRWVRSLGELVPFHKGFVERSTNVTRWYTQLQVEGDPRRSTGRIRITLLSQDELAIAVADGSVEMREVPLEELGADAEALRSRAVFLLAIGESEQGEALHRRALAANPKDFEAGRSLAAHLTGEQRFSEAAEVWRRLDAQNLGLEDAGYLGVVDIVRYELASVLVRAQSYPEALETVMRALEEREGGGYDELVPGGSWDTRYRLLLGEIHLYLGDVQRSRSSFDDVIRREARLAEERAPSRDGYRSEAASFYDTVQRVAGLFRKTGHPELADRYRMEGERRARAISQRAALPEDPSHRALRAEALLDLGDVEGAIAVYEPIAETARYATFPHLLGAIYLDGDLVPRDLEAALRWYALAARKTPRFSSSQGKIYFALCYLHRHAREEPDAEAAAEWCRRSADVGDAEGSFWLGILYASGTGVAHDEMRAAQLLAAAREKGYLRATGPSTAVLDRRYRDSPSYRRGDYFFASAMTPDFQWAARVLEPLAAQGVTIAETTLGKLYRGSWLGPLQDQEKAVHYFERAARHGDGPSMLDLAHASRGDPCANYAWLEAAVDAGQSWGHYYIAQCHIRGRVEKPDLAIAESALRAFTELWFRDHPRNLDGSGPIERPAPSEKLYVELEHALRQTVDRPVRVKSVSKRKEGPR